MERDPQRSFVGLVELLDLIDVARRRSLVLAEVGRARQALDFNPLTVSAEGVGYLLVPEPERSAPNALGLPTAALAEFDEQRFVRDDWLHDPLPVCDGNATCLESGTRDSPAVDHKPSCHPSYLCVAGCRNSCETLRTFAGK
jgi:hypothetical protein